MLHLLHFAHSCLSNTIQTQPKPGPLHISTASFRASPWVRSVLFHTSASLVLSGPADGPGCYCSRCQHWETTQVPTLSLRFLSSWLEPRSTCSSCNGRHRGFESGLATIGLVVEVMLPALGIRQSRPTPCVCSVVFLPTHKEKQLHAVHNLINLW